MHQPGIWKKYEGKKCKKEHKDVTPLKIDVSGIKIIGLVGTTVFLHITSRFFFEF